MVRAFAAGQAAVDALDLHYGTLEIVVIDKEPSHLFARRRTKEAEVDREVWEAVTEAARWSGLSFGAVTFTVVSGRVTQLQTKQTTHHDLTDSGAIPEG